MSRRSHNERIAGPLENPAGYSQVSTPCHYILTYLALSHLHFHFLDPLLETFSKREIHRVKELTRAEGLRSSNQLRREKGQVYSGSKRVREY